MAEFENPTRRYKWFRPRQAARGYGFIGATNTPIVSLFNDSTGPELLVVRALRVVSSTGALSTSDFAQQGELGTEYGQPVLPLVPSMAAPPGTIYVADVTSVPQINGYNFTGPQSIDVFWEQDFPLAVIEPGWSYGLIGSIGKNLQVSFVWEHIFADELDFYY
ncbi:MAG TPA: hypothetical protein VGH29_20725 [Candidatus Binataceae bacterium]